MRRAQVLVHGEPAAILEELGGSERNRTYRLSYLEGYDGPPVSLALPVRPTAYEFDAFPPFFDGLLPEGVQLEGLLRQGKMDAGDYFSQLVAVGGDLVGAVTVDVYPEDSVS